MIAEYLYSQVDDEGNEFLLLDEIIDHCKDDPAITAEEVTVDPTGAKNQHYVQTTKGWKLSVTWKDVSTSWEPLKYLKEAKPIQVAEYAMINKLDKEPAFRWKTS